MGVKAGLDPAVMIEVLNAGSGATSASRDKFPRAVLPAHLRLRLCHWLDGQRCPALSGRSQSARRAGRRRRDHRPALGGRPYSTRAPTPTSRPSSNRSKRPPASPSAVSTTAGTPFRRRDTVCRGCNACGRGRVANRRPEGNLGVATPPCHERGEWYYPD